MKTKTEKIKFGGVSLDVLHQTNTNVPTFAHEIDFEASDKKALGVAIQNNLPTLLIGETGTGKTSIIRYLAFLRKQGYTRIGANGYITPEDLLGKVAVKNGSTYFEYGVLVKAMIEGHIVVWDEINATPPDCTFIAHSLLDDDKKITLPNGEIIVPHKDFRFFATMNPDYEGTRSLNRAFMDRFNIILNIDILLPAKEKELLMKRLGVTAELAENMIKVAWLDRKAYKEQKTLTLISTRSLLQWGGLIKEGLTEKVAFVTSIANKARAEERTAFIDFYNAVMRATGQEENLDAPVLTTVGEMKKLNTQVSDLEQKVAKREHELSEEMTKSSEWKTKCENAEKRVKDLETNAVTGNPVQPGQTQNSLFMVGDVVEGISEQYAVTRVGWRGEVISVSGNKMNVKRLGGGGDKNGYDVEMQYFKKI